MHLLWCVDFIYTGCVLFKNNHHMAAPLSARKYKTLSITKLLSASPVDALVLCLPAIASSCSCPMTSWWWHDAAAAMMVK